MKNKLKKELIQKLSHYFPSSKIEINERRSIILELRVIVDEDTFIEVYANIITGKRSFSIISMGSRIVGYDNYKFWHYHPSDNPDEHLSCEEPSMDFIFTKFREVLLER